MGQELIRINLDGVNSYLLKSNDQFILCDCGGPLAMDKGFNTRREKLVEELEKAGCRPGNLKLLILTHGDSDHVFNTVFIKERYQTKIAMHQGDVYLVENPTLDQLMESFRYRSLGLKALSLLIRNLLRRVTMRILEKMEKFRPDVLLNDGASLMEYGFDATILYTPGHTPGSIGILLNDHGFISGDTFANIKKPGTAPNANHFKTLDVSAAKIKALGVKQIYPGHGEPFMMPI